MSLQRYVVRRVAQLAVTYFLFLSLLFILFRMVPGDPTTLYLVDGISAETRQEILERHGLHLPLHEQYIHFMSQYLSLDLGHSIQHNQPVYDIIVTKFWNTVFLMGAAFFLAYSFGTLFGALLGWYRGTDFEKYGMIMTLAARSSPEFWIGMLLLLIFSFWLGLFPTGGMYPPGTSPQGFAERYFTWSFAYHMVLPVLTGAIFYMAAPTLLMRNNMIQVMNEDYLEIKEAIGVPTHKIIYKHAVRNAILPVVTLAAIVTGVALGGSLIIETVFNWPGMGREIIQALNTHDYPVATATVFLMGSVIIFMNFVADLLYIYLDPRVTYE